MVNKRNSIKATYNKFRYSNVIFILFAINLFVYSQPMNNSNISTLIDTTIFKIGLLGSCHASTIVETSPGNFIAAWFAGSNEGADDVAIWISKLKGNKWSQPLKIAEGRDSSGNQLPCWNPVLFKTTKNKIILFYKVGKNPREWNGMFIQSFNNGKTWSKPQLLPSGFLGPIKDKPIQLKNGNILCPSSVEKEDGDWSIHLELTNEELSKWKKIKIEKDSNVGVIQPTILLHKDGKLQMLCRSKNNFIYQTWSNDGGNSWSKLAKTLLHNPNSGIDAVTLNDGRLVLVYNPLIKGKEWYKGRNILNVAISNDGKTWTDVYQLEKEKEGEYSYPAVIQASDKSIQITYTYKRKSIKYVVLNIE